MMARSVLVCGAGGFIGHHLVDRLKGEGCRVRGVDLVAPAYAPSSADEFILGDLRDPGFVAQIVDQSFDEVYQLAADMGGAGYIFTGENDAAIMHNSASINLNMLEAVRKRGCGRIFFSSSACVYPEGNQLDAANPRCDEASAYPADPDSDYGWEKLFSERLYAAYARNWGLNVRIARFHNIFGPEGCWNNGREKAPAAICRKVAMAQPDGEVEIWGDGEQTRSFLFIDECLDGVLRLTRSDVAGPVNIGSDQLISINGLVDLAADIAGKRVAKKHISGPLGVRGRVSDNRLIRERLGWAPEADLRSGLTATYRWISQQIEAGRTDKARG
jgi:GDP-D-mannose 3', 5'-epimerase